jgi:hypothetical protein
MSKEGTKIFRWRYNSSKIMKGKMGRSIKLIPVGHVCELEAGIMLASKIRICNKSISNLYFIIDTMNWLPFLVLDFLFLLLVEFPSLCLLDLLLLFLESLVDPSALSFPFRTIWVCFGGILTCFCEAPGVAVGPL